MRQKKLNIERKLLQWFDLRWANKDVPVQFVPLKLTQLEISSHSKLSFAVIWLLISLVMESGDGVVIFSIRSWGKIIASSLNY